MQTLLDLLTGHSEEPSLEIEPFLGILDSYARELSARLAAGRSGGSDDVQVANQYLFEELGFTATPETTMT